MKTSTQTTVVLKALDMELKAMIETDLRKFKKRKDNKGQSKQLIAA